MSDAFSLLTKALSAPKDQQQRLLDDTKAALAQEPKVIQPLVGHLLPVVSSAKGAEGELLKGLFIDVLEIGICRSQLPFEIKTSLALTSVETLAPMLQLPAVPSSPSTVHLKSLVAISASIYPLIFRHLCSNKTNTLLWGTLTRLRDVILRWATEGVDERRQRVPRGVRLSAIKFLQRVVLVQTKGSNDPRVYDPNLSNIPDHHPFLPIQPLEAQSLDLLEFILLTLYNSSDSTLLTAVLSLFPPFVRLRPSLTTVLVPALTSWTPKTLEAQGKDRGDVRATEKLVRALMYGFERSTSIPSTSKPGLQEALAKQNTRMETAYRLQVEEARAKRSAGSAALPPADEPAAKRIKLEQASQGTPPPPPGIMPAPSHPSSSTAQAFDVEIFNVQSLAAPLVIDLTMASLTSLSLPALSAGMSTIRTQLSHPPGSWSTSTRLLAPLVRSEGRAEGEVAGEAKVEDGLESNPLEMDVDGERDEDVLPDLPPQPPQLVPTHAESKPVVAFALPPPRPLSREQKRAQIVRTLGRLLETGEEKLGLSEGVGGEDDLTQGRGMGGIWDLWMVLGARLVTRGDEEDTGELGREREAVLDWVTEDFTTRWRFASLWLNEEWYNDYQGTSNERPTSRNYRSLLFLLLQQPSFLASPSLPAFLLSLPDLPHEALQVLQSLCEHSDRALARIGMRTLRELVVERPPVRELALGQLLELCTHPDAAIRNPAIVAVRQWVPDTEPMADSIKSFALSLLRRLIKASTLPPLPSSDVKSKTEEAKPDGQPASEDSTAGRGEESMEDVRMEVEAESEEVEHQVDSRYLTKRIDLERIETETVRQHVELLFALTKKIPDLLDDIFAAYIDLPQPLRPKFELVLSPLIRSMGPNNGKLLTVLRTFPPGADMLALKTLHILTESKHPNGEPAKMSAPMFALVKSLVSERSLDARFVITIMGELDKSDLRKQIPRIISILPGKALSPDAPPPEREQVRQIINQLVTPGPSANTPAAKKKAQLEAFTPAELMVLLHSSEKNAGLKATMEAIDICFSMTDVFRAEVLAAVMQQIVDEPELPTLFLRTVIKSVQTYKSLVPFVSTSLLSRLITKKVWTSPQLWEGFIRCARVMGMASYGALLQLPREQLKEIVGRPDGKLIKTGLKDFVVKRAGGNAAKTPSWFSEVFPEDDSVAPLTSDTTPLSIHPATTPPPAS